MGVRTDLLARRQGNGESVAKLANWHCDNYGIDTISFGTMTGFIMDCYENGILNKERTGGLEMTWGNWRAALELMHQMALSKKVIIPSEV